MIGGIGVIGYVGEDIRCGDRRGYDGVVYKTKRLVFTAPQFTGKELVLTQNREGNQSGIIAQICYIIVQNGQG